MASNWKLVWWRFRKNRLAVASAVVLLVLYIVVLVPGFFATHDPEETEAARAFIPLTGVSLRIAGGLRLSVPSVTGLRDPILLKMVWKVDPTARIPIRFFARGYRYRVLGVFWSDRHLVGPADPGSAQWVHLLGTDRLGRDQWSRMMYGTRTSLTVSMAAVAMSVLLGVAPRRHLGLLRRVDRPGHPAAHRAAAVAAHHPDLAGDDRGAADRTGAPTRSSSRSPSSWPSSAGPRSVARCGAGSSRCARRTSSSPRSWRDAARRGSSRGTWSPRSSSHIIASSTLAVPVMIISETSLSFLGLGIRPPAISWGVLLQEAQNIQTVALAPWLHDPGTPRDRGGAGIQPARRRPARCRGSVRHWGRWTSPLLSVRGLKAHFFMDEGVVKAVDGVSFDVHPGRVFGIVGESGCGKSVTMKAVLRVIEPPGRIVGGGILLRRDGETVDLATLRRERQARCVPSGARRSR